VTTVTPRLFGGQSMVAPLRRVLVRRPDPASASLWRSFGWRAEPDARRLVEEHDALCAALTAAGADVVVASAPLEGDPDAVYTFDPTIVCDRGAILLRPGKAGRRVEVAAVAADLEAAGVPVHARLEPPALAEGGDTLWLDERTLLVGIGYRTNKAGADTLREAAGVEVRTFPGGDLCLKGDGGPTCLTRPLLRAG
jgi:N-dimethylarginine dimethylaminohydrolase